MTTNHLEIIQKLAVKKKSKHPLIFVHGAAVGAWFFNNFLEYFSMIGYDSYAFSFRGHGNSYGYEHIDSYSLDDYKDDLIKVIKTLNEKPIVIGHSMGGAVVQRLIDTHQEFIDKAILIASPPPKGINEDSLLGLFFSDVRQFLRSERKKYPEKTITIDSIFNEHLFNHRFSKEIAFDILSKLTKESLAVKKDLLKPIISDLSKVKIKVNVMGSKDDEIITKESIIETALFYQTKPIFLDHLCHLMPIDPKWLNLAKVIEKELYD